MSRLIEMITSTDPLIRNASLDDFASGISAGELLNECKVLESFRKTSDNLYERVRALFFLYAIHRFHLPVKPGVPQKGSIPYSGYEHLLQRRFEESIRIFTDQLEKAGPSDSICSALASAYHSLGFQTLADQVRKSVRSVKGNQWMFRIGHPADHALRIRKELFQADSEGLLPILTERTPVRMDLSHSGWSDIFFLGMDFPEGARVLNVSIDLCVRDDEGSAKPKPPVETYLRVIDQPVLKLVSLDLEAEAEITSIADVFDFAKDYLGLLKAAVIASGIVPPGMEGAQQPLEELLGRLVRPGYGLEIVSQVNGIPKGSRLAVSTNLLASLIALCMRATGQIKSLTGALTEEERRMVAARAILGEWLGGSGGGWQDSGGVWPAIKRIQGVEAGQDDPEFGISKGCLLPRHHVFSKEEISPEIRKRLQDSLVLVHGGMAQDVGPILEMVTEKYLLRSPAEWEGRKKGMRLFDTLVDDLKKGNIPAIGKNTQANFEGPIQTIIPWASNYFTETIIKKVEEEFKQDFWGFWMLGGMSGGGMGFIFHPDKKEAAQTRLRAIMREVKRQIEKAVPFAINPVVYDFEINEHGTMASLLSEDKAFMPEAYYIHSIPKLLRQQRDLLPAFKRREIDRFSVVCRNTPSLSGVMQNLFDRLLPEGQAEKTQGQSLIQLFEAYGFDSILHEQIRADLKNNRIGLAQNRLPVSRNIEDVVPGDVFDISDMNHNYAEIGKAALAEGAVAVVSMAGGVGSRWTKGAGVVKALNPFCKLEGRHRSFIEIHLAKSRRAGRLYGAEIPHIITTSYLTHTPIEQFLAGVNHYGYTGPLMLSPGRFVGLRFIPMVRDLVFAWEEMSQQMLDEQAQKMLESLRSALMHWARHLGEGNDYTDNLPLQCLHPVGHWYEIPNLLCNGVLEKLLAENPNVKHLLLHNIDTLGANVDPGLLGYHIEQKACLSNEVITRRLEDRGGGLARVDGRVRLVEGLALPREEIEFDLSYYNTGTFWIDIDRLLSVFHLNRKDLKNKEKVLQNIRDLSARMPTYITLKDVKKRWGKGQEDVYPVTQFEKLWGDMTALPEIVCRYAVVPRLRGQQLKEPAQLDGWLRDGSAAYVNSLCDW